MNHKLFFTMLIVWSVTVFAQDQMSVSFKDIRKNYEKRCTDDERALPHVKRYIQKAKAEKNYRRWVQGYRDAVQFSADVDRKMIYVDSTIVTALQSEDPDLIANAYLGKGIIYYFNLKKFREALDQYIAAQEYAENTDDEYLKNKIEYHIGVVKSYLGLYDQAAENFVRCIRFYEGQIPEQKNTENTYNYTKGYFNSMHQLTVVYRLLGRWKNSDSLMMKGLKLTADNADFKLENAYFSKCRGISEYRHKRYNEAIFFLNKSLPQIVKRDDFAWASVIYFYKGKTFWDNNGRASAMRNFEKIDSIFNRRRFIVPEVRPAYELMIMHAQQNNDIKSERYFTKQLLTVDEVIRKDFTDLSSKIHRSYDRKKMLQEKRKMERTKMTGYGIVIFLMVLAVILWGIIWSQRRKKREIWKNYMALQHTMDNGRKEIIIGNAAQRKSGIPDDVAQQLSVKVKRFEEKQEFKIKGLTINEMAKKLGTNSNYLSAYINDTKEMNFKRYLSELRIQYIIRMLNENPVYLKLTITALSDDAGFNYRQNFSDAFLEITGMRPADYIKQKNQEISGGNS